MNNSNLLEKLKLIKSDLRYAVEILDDLIVDAEMEILQNNYNSKTYNYRQMLDKAQNHHLDILMLEVAYSVDFYFVDNKLNNKDFEFACTLIQDAYLKSEDLSIDKLAIALNKLILEDKKALENITRRMLIDKACYI